MHSHIPWVVFFGAKVLHRRRGLDCTELPTDFFIRTKHPVSLNNSIVERASASITDSSQEIASGAWHSLGPSRESYSPSYIEDPVQGIVWLSES